MILSGASIIRRMEDPFPDKLVVTPLLNEVREKLESGAPVVDVRLGQDFIIADRSELPHINPIKITTEQLTSYLRRIHVPIGNTFVLHPRQFALGATLEYCKLPADIVADVTGRSRWARVGLVIAMATFVNAGFAGCLTLELQNLGDVPLRLYPGLPIAQIIFQECEPSATPMISQFHCGIGPEFPQLVNERDKKVLNEFENIYRRRYFFDTN